MIKTWNRFIEKNREAFWLWILFFIILLVAYIQFLNPYITCDHMGLALFQTVRGIPNWEDIQGLLSGGRFGNILILWAYYFLGKVNVSHYSNIYVIQILGIALYAISCVILFRMFHKYIQGKLQKYILVGLILLCFINPFMVETYLYGSFDWAYGILFSVLAAKYFSTGKLIRGFLLALWAVSIYQTNILIVIIISFLVFFIDFMKVGIHDWKKFIIRLLSTGSLSVVAALIVILSYKIYALTGNYVNPAKEAVVSSDYLSLIMKVISDMKSIYVTMYSLYPTRFIPWIVLITLLITIYILTFCMKKYVYSLVWIIITGILFVTPFAYMLASGNTWAAQRTLLPVFFSLAMFLLGALYIVQNSKVLMSIYAVICCVVFLVTIYYTQTCIVDTYMGQALDYSEVLCIQSEIEEYEETTGIEVKKVSWKKSPEMTYVHPLLHFQNDSIYTHRIICDAGDYLLKYATKEDYELLWMTEEEYRKYFDGRSWDVFNPSQQLHFEGDTLYWVVY